MLRRIAGFLAVAFFKKATKNKTYFTQMRIKCKK